jgi:hypothetical protein
MPKPVCFHEAGVVQEMGVRSSKGIGRHVEDRSKLLTTDPQLVASMLQGVIGVSRRPPESAAPEKHFGILRREAIFLVDLTVGMFEELDKAAHDLNVSRQAVIKSLVRQALDQHSLAQRSRR